MKVLWPKLQATLVPVLFPIYAVLAFYAHNLGSVAFHDIVGILAVSILLGIGLPLFLQLIVGQRIKASLIAICWLFVFYSYGHYFEVISKNNLIHVGGKVLYPLAVLLMLGLGWVIWKSRGDLSPLLTFFGVMATVLLGMVAYSLITYLTVLNRDKPSVPASVKEPTQLGVDSMPDIYYIILDGHGRQDILKDLYGYDDSGFIQFLERNGFNVAGSSHSNYDQTVLSLGSSLNMEYIDPRDLPSSDPIINREWLSRRISDSLVRRLLAERGYQTVGFSNEYLTIPPVYDINFDYRRTPAAATLVRSLHTFDIATMFVSSTMARAFVNGGSFQIPMNSEDSYRLHYDEVNYDFDMLTQIPKMPGNYFVFAHILSPHAPFVFAADGSFVHPSRPYSIADGSAFEGSLDEYLSGYSNQVAYVDAAMEHVISLILANSSPAPIIILQSDHGPGAYVNWESVDDTNLNERMSILNAYYFPGNPTVDLYESISPVNSFRALFDGYFGSDFPLLEDRSYYSTWSHPFDFIDVTDRLKR